LFFAGTATHSLDFRKSAGGFVHGFRYTARTLHHLLEWRNHGKVWPSTTGHVTDLLTFVLKRINEASGLYQMYSTLCDVIALRGETFEYIEEFPSNLLHEFEKHSGISVSSAVIVTLDYGANFSGPAVDTFREDRASGDPSEAFRSNFLHPVLYYYKRLPDKQAMKNRRRGEMLPKPDRLHHTIEDFLTTWDAPNTHILPLRRFLEYSTGKDLRQFFVEDCLEIALTHFSLPDACKRQFKLEDDDLGMVAGGMKKNNSEHEVNRSALDKEEMDSFSLSYVTSMGSV